MILDNINKLLSFKVGGNPTSKTSLASDKASSIELQYNFSVDTNLKLLMINIVFLNKQKILYLIL